MKTKRWNEQIAKICNQTRDSNSSRSRRRFLANSSPPLADSCIQCSARHILCGSNLESLSRRYIISALNVSRGRVRGRVTRGRISGCVRYKMASSRCATGEPSLAVMIHILAASSMGSCVRDMKSKACCEWRRFSS